MKIGMLSQWFDPEPGPAAIPGVLAREFVSAGHEVSVLTGFPNYPEGRIHDGFRQRTRLVTHEAGTTLTRVALYPNHSASAVGRIANYMSFAASAAIFGRNAFRGVDAVWAYNSPVSVSWPLLAHTRNGRTPYFLHVQDLWPDSLIESGMFAGGVVGAAAAAAIRRVVRATENRSSVVGVISPSVRDLILSRNPSLSPEKIVYVPNPTDELLFTPVSRLREAKSPEREDQFVVMYLGAMGNVQGLDTLLKAAELLKSNHRIKFSLVGDGIARARLEREAHNSDLTNVTFHARIGKEAVPAMLASADAQLVSLADSEFLRYTTPSKIASLLASEVPIIGHIAGDGASLLAASGSSLIASPGDFEGLAAAVTEMAEMDDETRREMATNGRLYYQANLSASVAASKVVEALKGSAE
jgi:colanic acid biosynthesis glycosyl transferase WcaI